MVCKTAAASIMVVILFLLCFCAAPANAKTNTTTTLASSLNPSAYGASVTFTATVSPSAATGTVTFKDGSATLGTGTLSSGKATYSTSTLAVGSHSITASYGGDTNYNGSTSSTLTQTVNRAITTTTLVSSLNPSTYGAAVTFTATLSPSTATGTVTFKDGSTTLGTGTLSGGKATYSTSTLAVASHSITAAYGGDTNDNTSTSSTLTQTVNKAGTTTTLASSANPSTFGASVTFTANLSPSTATGTVTFKDGTTTLGTSTLASGKATLTTTTLAGGSHSITAAYGGDKNDATSTSSTLTQTVNKASSTTVVSSSLNPSTFQTAVTFTATLSPSTATGTVSFDDGGTLLGTGTVSGGKATYATATLATGTHSISAAYGGDGNFNASSSSNLTQTVNAVTPIITSLSPTSGAVGASVTITGTNFGSIPGSSTVTFNGVSATSSSWSTTQIKAPVPAGAATGGIVVTVGGLASSPTTFTVKPKPTITSVSNLFGAVGISITITGTNFGSSQGSSTVKFNGTAATATAWSAGQITVTVPTGATSGALVVHTSGIDVSAGNFAVVTIASLAVSPLNPTLPENSWERFQVIATNSDGSSQNIASNASWTSSNTAVATIDSTGVLTAVSEGQTVVGASFGSFSGSTTLTIQGRSFVTGAILNQVRTGHTATLLPNGTVLIAGGYGGYADSNNYAVLSSIEIYDPTAKTFTLSGGMNVARSAHSATLLQNGKVLIVGGVTPLSQGYTQAVASAEIYDPSTGLFTVTGSLSTPRFNHTATLLQNGKVLVTGGGGEQAQGLSIPLTSAELYDPSSGTFSSTGSLSVPRGGAPASLLPDGTVFLVGGGDLLSQYYATSDVYNPAAGTFSPGGSLPSYVYYHSASVLNTGKLLVAGGIGTTIANPWANAYIYDPTAAQFSPTASMALAREGHTATLLSDGTVLMVGGENSSLDLPYDTAEFYNATKQVFTGAGSTTLFHSGHTATLLEDGTVLIAGGNLGDGTSELYDPNLPAPTSITITPATATIVDGATKTFVAVDNNGQTRSDAVWTISDPTVASLQSTTQPLVTAIKPGQVTLTADVDGITAQAQITIAPRSLQITPASVTMLVGDSHQFTVVDELGRPSSLASWSTINPSLVSVGSGSSPILTGLASGTATLTAEVEGVSAQASVTISSSGSFGAGTAIWSAPSASGFTGTQLAQALPSGNLVALYLMGISGDGSQSSIQGMTGDGQQMWQTTLPALAGAGIPDGSGGILGTEACTATNPMTVVDVAPGSGSFAWELPFPLTTNGQPVCLPGTPKLAVRQDGSVIVALPLQISPRVLILPGNSGGATVTVTIPPSTSTDYTGAVTSCDCLTPVGQPIVNSDGSIYLEYEVRQIPYPPTTVSSVLSLLTIAEDGTTTTVQLSSSDSANLFPGALAPDGNGGVIATWTIVPASPPAATQPYQAAYVSGGRVLSTYPLPYAPTQISNGPDGLPVVFPFALGNADNLFVSYGSTVVSFNFSSGAANWSFQSPSAGSLSIMAALDSGGVAINDSSQGVLQLDSGGNAGTPLTSGLGAIPQYPWGGEDWYVQNGTVASQLVLPLGADPANVWATPGGNPSGSFGVEALCDCDVQTSTDTTDDSARSPVQIQSEGSRETASQSTFVPAANVANCPICSLPAPVPTGATEAPSCVTLGSGGSNYVLLVGDSGYHSHNAGQNFNIVAQTAANGFVAQGNTVSACRISSVENAVTALTINGFISGGVYYYGHGGPFNLVDQSGHITGTVSILAPGQQTGTDSNISFLNVAQLTAVETAYNGSQNILGSSAAIWINGCSAGRTIYDDYALFETSIAQQISNNTQRGVYAYEKGMYFSLHDAASGTSSNYTGEPNPIPAALPLYLVPNGPAGNKPLPLAFTPQSH